MKETEPTIPTVLSSLSFEKPEPKYTFDYSIVVFPSETRIQLPDPDLPWKVTVALILLQLYKVQQAVDGIIKIDSAEKKQEIQQWVDDSDVKESQ